MLRYSLGAFTLLILYSTLTLDAPSKEEIQPKIRRHSQMLLEGDKRYIDDIEYWPKRYVGDRKKEDIELRRYTGTKKAYIGEESEKEFFKRETESLYRFTSLQKNVESIEGGGEKLAVIIGEDNVLSNMSDAKINMETKEKIEIEKKERKIQGTERKIAKNDREIGGGERKISGGKRETTGGERKVSGNERETTGNKRNIYGNKREKIDVPTVVIEK